MALCVMFHSVGLRRYPWAASHIAEDIQAFRAKIESIRDSEYEIVPFSDPRLHDPACRQRLLCLTFDDGYLDNWVHVAPILQEFEMPATIFVSTEFVDPRDVRRAQAGCLADEHHDPTDCCAGFLSWNELRELQSGGLIEIGSHAATHTQWPVAPEIVDYWRPGSATALLGPVHELWNARPERKPFYLTAAPAEEATIPYGSPVYRHERALIARRFFAEDDELRQLLGAAVEAQGAASFFADPARARAQLDSIARDWLAARGGSIPGRFEREDEREGRIFDELQRSRTLLSDGLGTSVDSICWPQGGVDERTLELARSAGYTRFTLPSAWQSEGMRRKYPDLVPRISSVPRVHRGGRDLGNLSGREFLWYLRRAEGSSVHGALCRLAVGMRLVRSRLVAPA